MNQSDDFSTEKISPTLISLIIQALKGKAFGSVEIYVENYNVVQITERSITKVRNQTTPQNKVVISTKPNGKSVFTSSISISTNKRQ